ncbi:MAG: dTDP-4-dehydrorhamnose reductase [Actinomycetota bacterium]
MRSARRYLVTGADGQLGRAFVRLLPPAEVVAFDRMGLDITDRPAVLAVLGRYRPDVVLHGAAYTKVDQAEVDSEGAWAVNVEGTRNVVDAAALVGAAVVYPSTDYVFSATGIAAFREDDPVEPLSVYGATKLEGERAVGRLPRGLVVRTSWVFGDGHNFLHTIIGAGARLGEVSVVDDQFGRPTSAWDLAAGLLSLAATGATGTFHLAGGGEPCSWADLAEAAIADAGVQARVRRVSTAEFLAGRQGIVMAPRPACSVLDCSRAAAFGVRLRPWREAVTEHLATRAAAPARV